MILKELRQIWVTAKASLKVRYRQSFAGILWVVLNPLILLTAQSIAFKFILKLEINNYLVFLSSGLLPWVFFVQTLEMSAGTVVNSGRLLKSYPLRPFVLVGAQFVDNLVNFLIGLTLVVGLGLILGDISLLHLPLALPGLFLLAVGTLALAYCGSIIQVFFRDFKFILSFFLQVLFFVTPVFYPSSFVPENFRWLIEANLVYRWILPVREAMVSGTVDPRHLFYSALAAFGSVILAFLVWRWRRNEIYQYL